MKARAKLENQAFVAKAPEAVVAEERARLSAAESILAEVRLQYEERIGGELPVLVEKRK
jgi:valyl-tRNA synthetase